MPPKHEEYIKIAGTPIYKWDAKWDDKLKNGRRVKRFFIKIGTGTYFVECQIFFCEQCHQANYYGMTCEQCIRKDTERHYRISFNHVLAIWSHRPDGSYGYMYPIEDHFELLFVPLEVCKKRGCLYSSTEKCRCEKE